MPGENSVQEIEKVPLSDNSISQHIDDMAHDSEEVYCGKLKNSSFLFRLISQQIPQINVMLWPMYVNEGEIQENYVAKNCM